MKKVLLFIFCVIATVSAAWAEDLPAFPGAEGFGRYVTGGRGGAVYHVTNLNDSGEGSLRWAIEQSGRRTIVFDVSGTIFLKSPLSINNGNVTIAGQTAPGDGICVAGYPFTIKASNVIIRFLRFRLGNENVADHEGDGLGGMDQSNIIVDHCSVSWSIDECCSIYGNENATVQWCIVSQSLRNSGHSKGTHGYGGNWGGKGMSYHHNLLLHHESRAPRLGPRQGTQMEEHMDMRNNVIYNWAGNGCYGGEGMDVNIYNNYYKPGPATRKKGGAVGYRIAAIGIRTLEYCTNSDGSHNGWYPMLHHWGQFYVDGNVMEGNADVTADNWTKGIYAQISNSTNDNTFTSETKDTMRLDAPLQFYATTTHTAEVAYEKVLQYAGACYSRDAHDSIMVADVRENKATFTSGSNLPGIIDSQDDCRYADGTTGWPELKSTAAPLDTDRDGMPDDWERAHGLDPNNPDDRNDTDVDGYTMLEVYMNGLVADIMDACTSDGELQGDIKDSESVVGPVDYELSSQSFIDGDSQTWNFTEGFSVSNPNNRGYAAGKNYAVKYSAGVPFTINIPEGKQVTAVNINGYSNGDSGLSYLTQLAGKSYVQADGYTFKSRYPSIVMTAYDFPLDEPVKDALSISFGGNQMCAIITLSVENVSTSSIEETVTDKDPNKIVDVYNPMGILIMKQVPYGDLFNKLPQGIYILSTKESLIIR